MKIKPKGNVKLGSPLITRKHFHPLGLSKCTVLPFKKFDVTGILSLRF